MVILRTPLRAAAVSRLVTTVVAGLAVVAKPAHFARRYASTLVRSLPLRPVVHASSSASSSVPSSSLFQNWR